MNRQRIVGLSAIVLFGTILIITLTKKKKDNIIDRLPTIHTTVSDSQNLKLATHIDTANLNKIKKGLDDMRESMDKMNGGIGAKNKKLGVDIYNDTANINFTYEVKNDAQNNAVVTIKQENITKTVYYSTVSYYLTFYHDKEYIDGKSFPDEHPLDAKQKSTVTITTPYIKNSNNIKVTIFSAYTDNQKMQEALAKMKIK